MPIVTIRILEGHSQATKQKIASGITEVITGAAGLQPSDIWITFEDVSRKDWFTGSEDSSDFPMPKQPD